MGSLKLDNSTSEVVLKLFRKSKRELIYDRELMF